MSDRSAWTQERIEKAERAKRLVNDPLFADAFDIVERNLFAKWRRASTVEQREEIWHTAAALALARQAIVSIAADDDRAVVMQSARNREPD